MTGMAGRFVRGCSPRPSSRSTASDLAYSLASGLLLGVTPFFVTGPLGSGKAGLGLALGAFGVTTLVFRPIVGRMADPSGPAAPAAAGGGAVRG